MKRSARVSPTSSNSFLLPVESSSSAYPTRLNLTQDRSFNSSASSQRRRRESPQSTRSDSMSSADSPHNPPTPNHLDISLHSLETGQGETDSPSRSPTNTSRRVGGRGGMASYFPPVLSPRDSRTRSPSPPPYLDQRHSWAVNSGSLGGTEASGNQARRASGRSHSIANALFGALADRGLLTPMSAQGTSQNDSPRAPLPPRHESTSVLDYERLQAANTQANSGSNSSSNTWFGSWFRA